VTQTPPSTPNIHQELPITEALLHAILSGITMQNGEPLVDPPRVSYSISRSLVESGTGRRVRVEYHQDELNPFGRIDLIVPSV
jgi:hypothetical protein